MGRRVDGWRRGVKGTLGRRCGGWKGFQRRVMVDRRNAE